MAGFGSTYALGEKSGCLGQCRSRLWCADDHRQDPGASIADPCTTTSPSCRRNRHSFNAANRRWCRHPSQAQQNAFVRSAVNACARHLGLQSSASLRSTDIPSVYRSECPANYPLASSSRSGSIRVPIALCLSLMTMTHPAVYSLKVCPTSARRERRSTEGAGLIRKFRTHLSVSGASQLNSAPVDRLRPTPSFRSRQPRPTNSPALNKRSVQPHRTC
jgi:hypothetical protein